jgi:hypothetical protein
MSNLYKIRLLYEPHPIPEAPEIEAAMPTIVQEELVLVKAEDLVQAARRSVLYSRIQAGGRLVRYFDEGGNEIHTF